jgi:hypothetical protein
MSPAVVASGWRPGVGSGLDARPLAPSKCPFSRVRAQWLLLPCIALAFACSNEEPAPKPTEPPPLRIQAVRAIGGGDWSPGGSEPLKLGCGASPVFVEFGPRHGDGDIGDWILRPPAACAGQKACGFLSVTIDPSSKDPTAVDSSSATVQVDLSTAGKHVIFAELRKEDGGGCAIDGGSVTCKETLNVVVPSDSECAAASNGSAGASNGSAAASNGSAGASNGSAGASNGGAETD